MHSYHVQWVHRTGNFFCHFVVGTCRGFYNVLGKLLTFRSAVFEAQEILRNHRCSDPICDTNLWKARHELDMAKLRIKQLERSLDRHGISRPKIKCVSVATK